jgi:glycosyltransferase involved in cell wall biosynthesis
VVFAGPVEGPVKEALLAEAWIMAFPSHSEGHPLVVLEGLSAALPVVTTCVGALPDTIEDGVEGYVLGVRDAGALANRIVRLITDDVLRSEMSRRARTRYEREFTAGRFVDSLAAVFLEILMTDRSSATLSGTNAGAEIV